MLGQHVRASRSLMNGFQICFFGNRSLVFYKRFKATILFDLLPYIRSQLSLKLEKNRASDRSLLVNKKACI